MKHKLTIICLHDAQAKCSCGWNITCTGERTKEHLMYEHKRHIKQENMISKPS